MIQWIGCSAMVWVLNVSPLAAQKLDEARMQRDIEVAANVLNTLIKQQFEKQQMFFPLEIKGSYQPGYGVTFSLPADYTTPIALIMGSGNVNVSGSVVYRDGQNIPGVTYSYSSTDRERVNGDRQRVEEETRGSISLRDQAVEKRRTDMDSIRNAYNLKVIEAAKLFIVDYGDMLTQLTPQERIVISNQGDQPRMWVNQYFNAPKRTHLSVEMSKADLMAHKQGKLNRDQALAKINVVNTESVSEVEPDLELLSSIFNRLYRSDLSKTYFTDNNIYFERLKDFGVIYYMQVFSSSERNYNRYVMPTVGLDDLDQKERDKKVKELYPQFEKELKENILEYGRTIKSLKDDEVLVFQVKVTKCSGCGIPSTIDYTLKGSTLREWNAGKIDKQTAVSRMVIKKGSNQ